MEILLHKKETGVNSEEKIFISFKGKNQLPLIMVYRLFYEFDEEIFGEVIFETPFKIKD